MEERVEKAISIAKSRVSAERIKHLQDVQAKVKSLQGRGLLVKNTFQAANDQELSRRYLSSGQDSRNK